MKYSELSIITSLDGIQTELTFKQSMSQENETFISFQDITKNQLFALIAIIILVKVIIVLVWYNNIDMKYFDANFSCCDQP